MDWSDFDPALDIDDPNETLGRLIPLTSILDRFGVEYVATGPDQYKVRCLWHKDGCESNPSLYLYEATHSYFCFTCHESGGVVELMAKLMGSTGTPGTLGYNLAIKELCIVAGITSGESIVQFVPPPKRPKEQTVEFWVICAGQELRKHLKTKEGRPGYEGWVVWADSRFRQLDRMLDTCDDEQWERAKDYYDATLKQIRGGK